MIINLVDLNRFILGSMIDFGYLKITLTTNLKVHATLLLGSELSILHKQGHISDTVLIAYRGLTVIKPVGVFERFFISM